MAGKLVLCLIFADNLPSTTIKFRKNLNTYFYLKSNWMIKYLRHIELEYIYRRQEYLP